MVVSRTLLRPTGEHPELIPPPPEQRNLLGTVLVILMHLLRLLGIITIIMPPRNSKCVRCIIHPIMRIIHPIMLTTTLRLLLLLLDMPPNPHSTGPCPRLLPRRELLLHDLVIELPQQQDVSVILLRRLLHRRRHRKEHRKNVAVLRLALVSRKNLHNHKNNYLKTRKKEKEKQKLRIR